MQRAIDRAYLVQEYGEVWKHARLTAEQYAETEFIADWPREGGIILDAVREGAGRIMDRVNAAVRPIFDRSAQGGLDQVGTLGQQLLQRRNYVAGMRGRTATFQSLIDAPPQAWSDAYSDRSIVKEIDQLVIQITPDRHEGSTVVIELQGSRWHPRLEFDAARAQRFHQAASSRELAAPVRVDARIRSLDSGNRFAKPKAKILNLATNREVTLHMSGEADFLALHPYHTAESVTLYVCPVLEAGGFDLNGGDLQFLAVA
ncbi:hypothetical protein [Methylibium sp.]